MNTEINTQNNDLKAEVARLRKENRYKMYTASKKIAKWTLIGIGALTVAKAVTNKTDEDEV